MRLSAFTLLLCSSALAIAQNAPQTASQANTGTLDPDGTAHITRVIPIPPSLSPEAQAMLRRPGSTGSPDVLKRRAATDAWQTHAGDASRAVYPVNVRSSTIARIPVRDITPLDNPLPHPDRVLLNVHGGGFDSDSGSFTESVPLANLTHTRVVAILYRLAPEHPFPAALDDTIAVYRELLKTYKPNRIALYGTSAGAMLTAEVAVRLRQLNLPLPAALGIFSGTGDLGHRDDALSMYALDGLKGSPRLPSSADTSLLPAYSAATDVHDPVLSPIYADLHNMPPTLFISSGRDLLLSGTTILHRAWLRNGNDARLVVFEGLPHAFWNDVSLPESKEAYAIMASFFDQQLSR